MARSRREIDGYNPKEKKVTKVMRRVVAPVPRAVLQMAKDGLLDETPTQSGGAKFMIEVDVKAVSPQPASSGGSKASTDAATAETDASAVSVPLEFQSPECRIKGENASKLLRAGSAFYE